MESLLAQAVAPEGSSGWVAIVTLLSVIVTALFQIYRENRNHQWETERRQESERLAEISRAQHAAELWGCVCASGRRDGI